MISRLNRRRLVRMAKKILSNRVLFDKMKQNSRNGSFNTFIKLTENWAMKCCTREGQTVYRNQRRAWRCGCGPFCFGLMRQKMEFGYGEFAYITEIVSTQIDRNDYWNNRYEKKISHIRIKMEKKASFQWTDRHSGNFGFKASTLVCIDFDQF